MHYPLPDVNPLLPEEALEGIPPEWFDLQLYQSNEVITRYCRDRVIDVYNTLELGSLLQTPQNVDALMRDQQYSDNFRYALLWMLRMLAVDDLLTVETRDGVHYYRQTRAMPESESAALYELALSIDVRNRSMLELLEVAISVYPDIARGKIRGEEAILGLNQLQLWLDFFQNDNPLYEVNNRIAAFAAVNAIEESKSLRILEFGAGAGSATEALLDELKKRNKLTLIDEYRVTEPNAFFNRKGGRLIAEKYPDITLTTGQLDINKPWQEQLGDVRFDLIYSVNTLHVAHDLDFVLQQAQRFLDGGWFIAGECIRPTPQQPVFTEMIFQILDSFIDVTLDDELRPHPGFLTPELWQRWFEKHAYSHVSTTPDIATLTKTYKGFISAAVCARYP